MDYNSSSYRVASGLSSAISFRGGSSEKPLSIIETETENTDIDFQQIYNT